MDNEKTNPVPENEQEVPIDRRAFFNTLKRTAMVGVLGAAAGFLAIKRKKTMGNQICINESICGACPNINRACTLPQALSFRYLQKQLRLGVSGKGV